MLTLKIHKPSRWAPHGDSGSGGGGGRGRDPGRSLWGPAPAFSEPQLTFHSSVSNAPGKVAVNTQTMTKDCDTFTEDGNKMPQN